MSEIFEVLEARLVDRTGVHVAAGGDATKYFVELAADVRRNACQPFAVSATVMAPGFQGFDTGEKISGLCVAKADGYWLVYRPEDDLFYAFWGTRQEDLGAHGVFGSPLYCWSA